MERLFIAICFTLFMFCRASAQPEKMDSLKKVLPTLHDTAKIDCLSSMAEYYLYSDIHQTDSIHYFISLVDEESKKINYKHGMAEAEADKAFLNNSYYYNYTEAEQLANESLQWFNLTSNKNKIALTYWQLSWAQCMQGKSEEALHNAKLCYDWALQTRDTGYDDRMINALETMTDIYRERGEYDKLLAVQQQLIDREKANGDDKSDYSIHELWVMGLMYTLLEDYQTALLYWRKLFSGKGNKFLNTWNLTEYAQLLTLANEPDSALYYYNLFDSAKAKTKSLRYYEVSKGEYFFYLKQYKTALPYFRQALNDNRQFNDHTQIKRSLLDIANTYAALAENDSAISYARLGLSMALQSQSKPSIRDGYQILYTVYNSLHQTDSAFYYYQYYMKMKEAVMDEQTKGKIAAYGYEHKIELLNKEKLIADQHLKMQQHELDDNALHEKILAGSLMALLVIGGFIIRTIILKRRNETLQTRALQQSLELERIESEKKQSELQSKASELEIQSLRSQMNPHFIFNCLSSINRFILKNKTEEASDYLTKFSRLIRMVLNHSKQSFISLEDELETLRLYLEMERLRFKNAFNYSFTYQNSVEVGNIFIPPLLLQPFAENAIWHGLLHKPEKGFLHFDFSVQDRFLCCIITDNGIGREKAEQLKSKSAEKQKSLGLKITTERLSLLNNAANEQTFFIIEDILDSDGNPAGTQVQLKIFFKEMWEL